MPVGAVNGFVPALLIGFWKRKRTWLSGVIVLVLIIVLLFFLLLGPVMYESNIE